MEKNIKDINEHLNKKLDTTSWMNDLVEPIFNTTEEEVKQIMDKIKEELERNGIDINNKDEVREYMVNKAKNK